MAHIDIINPTTMKITAGLEDAVAMVQMAAENLPRYANDVKTIFEKMPEFEYVHFCFYAYDCANLFEQMLECDPKEYLSFTMDAPESFFYTLYGGMAGLYHQAVHLLDQEEPEGLMIVTKGGGSYGNFIPFD